MTTPESTIQAQAMIAASRCGARLFRNHVGTGYMGRVVHREGATVTISPARQCTFGLAPGSSDLIGWAPVLITPDMVGQTLPVFASVELKTDTGRLRPEQIVWLDTMRAIGARAGVARNAAEAVEILTGRSLT